MKHACWAIAALVGIPAIGCYAGANPSGAQDSSIGTVQAALSALGPDGATYSIPTTDYLVIAGANGGCDPILSTPTQTTSLPVGAYSFYLSANGCGTAPADAGATIPFTLSRTGDGGTSTVIAQLANPVQTVKVAAGSLNSLVFRFTVAQVGNVTMGAGTVTVSITADASAGPVAPGDGVEAVAFTGTLLNAPRGAGVTDAGIAAVSSLLSASASGSVTVGIAGLSAFTPSTEDRACASFTPTVTTSNNSAGLPALFQELSAPGTTAELCFWDQYSAFPNDVEINITRTGAPVTSAFQTVYSTMPSDTPQFQAFINGTAAVNNGVTLSTAQFASPVSLTSLATEFDIGTTTSSALSLGYVTTQGTTGTLTLSP